MTHRVVMLLALVLCNDDDLLDKGSTDGIDDGFVARNVEGTANANIFEYGNDVGFSDEVHVCPYSLLAYNTMKNITVTNVITVHK